MKKGLELLREPFRPDQIEKLPKPYKKDSPKGNCKECGKYHGLPAAHLDYVGHAALTNRLLDVDINWTWEPMSLDETGMPKLDKSNGLWIKLTICGITRPGYGSADKTSFKTEGNFIKELIGDALRNAAMRFGAALDLWSKVDLHVEEPEKPAFKIDPAQAAKDEAVNYCTGKLPEFRLKEIKNAIAPMDEAEVKKYFQTLKPELGIKR